MTKFPNYFIGLPFFVPARHVEGTKNRHYILFRENTSDPHVRKIIILPGEAEKQSSIAH